MSVLHAALVDTPASFDPVCSSNNSSEAVATEHVPSVLGCAGAASPLLLLKLTLILIKVSWAISPCAEILPPIEV